MKLITGWRLPNLYNDGAPWVYGLTKAGAQLFGGKPWNGNIRTLDHELEISEFHIALEEYCDKHHLILEWRQDNLKHGIHPDAFFTINGVPFFLEIERQRIVIKNDEPTIKTKLDRYYDYYDTAECEKAWGFRKFRVVTIMKTDTVRQHVLPLLEKNRMFWMGTRANLTSDFHTPKGDIFQFQDALK